MSDVVARGGPAFHADMNRTRSLRGGLLHGAAGPVAVACYALLTFVSPHRPAMLLTVAMMALNIGLTWLFAERIIRSPYSLGWQVGAILTHIAGMAVLVSLDGGVNGPLGALAVFAMLLFAATLPTRMLLVVCAASGIAYWTVAQLGPAAPPGYAETMMIGTAGVAYMCHRYAAALVTLRRRLADISRTDPLTGCLNRRGFGERLQAELDRSRSQGTEVSLVVADLDRFKEVNDSHGHLVGDELLAWTGRTLREVMRGQDVIGRLGGDEFAMVLPDAGAAGAEVSVRRFREALGDIAPGSFGVASHPADAGTVDELTTVADQRLYEDKAGRDRAAPRADLAQVLHGEAVGAPVHRVSRFDRRRRTMLELGALAAACHLIGLNYTLLWSRSEHRGIIVAALSLGVCCGLLTVAAASRLSRTRLVGPFMVALSIPEFAAAAVAVVLDGGVVSPMHLGLLAPLPLVAFGSPPRHGAPTVAVVLVTYIGIGVLVGDVNLWYVAMYAGGALGLAVTFGVLGRSAARQRQLLTRLSRVDALTECLNRRGFEERMEAELSRIARNGGSAQLLLLDLDGFKGLNDTQGHAAGDALLVWVAETLRAATREQGAAGRLGGDEFVVLLTEPVEPAPAAARRLRTALRARAEVSIGTATLGEHGTDFPSLYARADAALCRQKAARRREAPAPATPA